MKGRTGSKGRLILVGAGPGDPDLITVRGAAALGKADVVLYDELASHELLSLVPDHAQCINVGKRGHDAPTRSQDDVQQLAIRYAAEGLTVVRLKGGDPFIFGRGGEEASTAVRAGIEWEIVPGVSAALAAPAYAGIPVTDRRHSASFAVVTGHKDPTRVSRDLSWGALAMAVDTLIVLMGMRNLSEIVEAILAGGRSPDTPAAAVMQGTLPEQRVVTAPLKDLPAAVLEAGLGAPASVVVGDVVALREELEWWESTPLFGQRILVTRARDQSAELASALRAAGAVPDVRPLIELLPCDSAPEQRVIDQVLQDIETYDDILFASTNAVRFFFYHAERLGLQNVSEKVRARILCIGARTAQAALSQGLSAHFVLAGGHGDAESMLAEIVGTLAPSGRRILVPQSDLGRAILPEGLRVAGARVDALPFYRNVPTDVDEGALRLDLVAGQIDALTFTSPSAVERFAGLLDEEAHVAATRCMIGAIGKTTAEALKQAGLRADVIPSRPDVRALAAALTDYVSGRSKGGEAGPEEDPY